MKKFFSDCKTLDELKKAYRAAAFKFHPDRGGDEDTMKAINSEYSARFEVLKREQNARAAADDVKTEWKQGERRTYATTEAPEDFINIIEALLKLQGITVELCGRWLWIGGDTKQHKDTLKAIGCKWCNTKQLWSWHFIEDGVMFKRHKAKSMDYIRTVYGSESFSNSANPDALPA